MKILAATVFWVVQASALLIFFVPFAWPLVALWAVSHFLRAIGLTLSFHRYFAHRAFQMNRARALLLDLRRHRRRCRRGRSGGPATT